MTETAGVDYAAQIATTDATPAAIREGNTVQITTGPGVRAHATITGRVPGAPGSWIANDADTAHAAPYVVRALTPEQEAHLEAAVLARVTGSVEGRVVTNKHGREITATGTAADLRRREEAEFRAWSDAHRAQREALEAAEAKHLRTRIRLMAEDLTEVADEAHDGRIAGMRAAILNLELEVSLLRHAAKGL